MTKLMKEPYCPEITNAKQIVALRNLIIHADDGIGNSRIWTTVVNHLRQLQHELEELLERN